MEKQNTLALFEGKHIRRIWHNNEWYFSVVDVIVALTDSSNPRNYWNMLKAREAEQEIELSTFCVQLKLISSDGKFYATDCANTEDLFRIIQSIPSKKAEPFKLWLAKVGYERIQEIENPELAQNRAREYYELKGYTKDWIEKRVRGIAIRQELTQEWKSRGVQENKDFAILTNEISKATFGKTVGEYKEFKNLPKESKANLRDHMNDLELIFTMLGERMTTELSQEEKPETFDKSKDIAKRGGNVAGNARIEAEKELGRPVTTKKTLFLLLKKRNV